MKIRLLNENVVSDLCWLAEYGFSAWIEYCGTNILFDAGWSDVWCRNAQTAGIDLNEVDIVALSHFHSDHSRGLLFHPFRTKKKLCWVVCLLLLVLATWHDGCPTVLTPTETKDRSWKFFFGRNWPFELLSLLAFTRQKQTRAEIWHRFTAPRGLGRIWLHFHSIKTRQKASPKYLRLR